MRPDGPLVRHPQNGPGRPLPGKAKHGRAQGGHEDGRRGEVGDVQWVVDPEPVVLDVDRAGTTESLIEDVERMVDAGRS